MSIIKGQNLRLKLGTKFVAFAQDCDLNVEIETEESSSKDSTSKSRDYEAVAVGYSLSTTALFSVDESESDTSGIDGPSTLDLALAGNKLSFEFLWTDKNSTQNRGTASSPTIKYTGTILINSYSIKATNKQNGSYTLNALGCGPLVKAASQGGGD